MGRPAKPGGTDRAPVPLCLPFPNPGPALRALNPRRMNTFTPPAKSFPRGLGTRRVSREAPWNLPHLLAWVWVGEGPIALQKTLLSYWEPSECPLSTSLPALMAEIMGLFPAILPMPTFHQGKVPLSLLGLCVAVPYAWKSSRPDPDLAKCRKPIPPWSGPLPGTLRPLHLPVIALLTLPVTCLSPLLHSKLQAEKDLIFPGYCCVSPAQSSAWLMG